MLGSDHLPAARELVKSKVATSMYRETDSAPWANDTPWDFEEEELADEDVDTLARAPGRGDRPQGSIGRTSSAALPGLPNGERSGFQYAAPQSGEGLLGWVIKGIFPTGPNNELRWHDGFVVEVQGFQLASPAVGRCYKYRLYYKVDSQDEWVEPPFDDKTLCFRKPHLPEHKMPEREIMRARRCMQAAEVAAAEAEAGTE